MLVLRAGTEALISGTDQEKCRELKFKLWKYDLHYSLTVSWKDGGPVDQWVVHLSYNRWLWDRLKTLPVDLLAARLS